MYKTNPIMSNTTSHYASYLKERLGLITIENDYGFITYRINGDECFITDFYVAEEYRNTGKGTAFFDTLTNIATEAGCTHLMGSVHVNSATSSSALIMALKYGFKLHKTDSTYVYLRKGL